MSKGSNTRLLKDTERYILNAIQDLRFGTVAVVVHDSRIVQVEVTERSRFDGAADDVRRATPACG